MHWQPLVPSCVMLLVWPPPNALFASLCSVTACCTVLCLTNDTIIKIFCVNPWLLVYHLSWNFQLGNELWCVSSLRSQRNKGNASEAGSTCWNSAACATVSRSELTHVSPADDLGCAMIPPHSEEDVEESCSALHCQAGEVLQHVAPRQDCDEIKAACTAIHSAVEVVRGCSSNMELAPER